MSNAPVGRAQSEPLFVEWMRHRQQEQRRQQEDSDDTEIGHFFLFVFDIEPCCDTGQHAIENRNYKTRK